MELQVKRALARLIEAFEDFETAKLLAGKIESRSLFHSQQCVEKSLKAGLSKILVGEITKHTLVKIAEENLYPLLSEELKNSFNEIKEEAFWTERRWIDTRYEELAPGGKINVPIFKFKASDARKGVEVAGKTLFWAIACVEFLFDVNLPTDYKKLKNLAKKHLT
ncbi:MAG: HEPN domain-containing protein [Nanoarchaeota archaeon]|nr:HEPN domain-containing protein [Nanoarchaeota archaeon]MBU1622275.1 HEPN domain-containing protein [Nanoarchaeota archaeon]MBU1973782.1 HEPN domain-containing protein [Nanoarchaeota archaeon]